MIKDRYRKDFGNVYKHFIDQDQVKPEEPYKHRFNSYYNSMSLPSRFYEKIYNFTKEEKEEEKDYWGHKCTD